MIDQAEVLKNFDGSILTYTGKRFYPLKPNAADVDPIDIAHALSNQCRYTGHTENFYSVAEHCVIMHDFLSRSTNNEQLLKTCLLHDADETYLLDLAAPIKHHWNGFGAAFIEAAKNIQEAIAEKFNLIMPEPPIIKEIDISLRTNEMRDLFPQHVEKEDWGEALPITIHCWTPMEAKAQFMFRLAANNIIRRNKVGDWVEVERHGRVPLGANSSWYY